MRRRSSVLDAINAFNSAYDTTTGVLRDIDLAKIAKAKPEELQGFTSDDAQQLNAAADSGQYDIGTKMNDDGSFAGYTVTPKSDPSQMGVIRQQNVTDFLGQRAAGSMTNEQVDNARMMAQAGVLSKYDPERGMRLRREARRDERDDKRFGVEMERADRERKAADEAEALKNAQARWFRNSNQGQAVAAYKQQLADYDAAMKDRQAKLQAGATPQELGTGPQQPTQRAMTYLDTLGDTASYLALLAENGKYDPAAWMSLGKAMEDVRKSGAVSALKLLQAGDKDGAIKEWNMSGQTPIDPNAVIQMVPVKAKVNGATVDSYELRVRQPDGKVISINAAQQLGAYDQADKLVAGHYQQRQDARAERADGRAGAAEGRAATKFQQDQTDRIGRLSAIEALAQESGATPAQVAAMKAGLLKAPGIAEQDEKRSFDMQEVDRAFSTTAPNKLSMDGKPVTIVNEEAKREFLDWWGAHPEIKGQERALQQYNQRRVQGKGNAQPSRSTGPLPAPAKGQVVNGMEFLGGNPKDEKNWRQTSGGAVR